MPTAILTVGDFGAIAATLKTNLATADIAFQDGGGACKSVVLANKGTANFLPLRHRYATDFHNNKIDVFDEGSPRKLRPPRSSPVSIRTCPPAMRP
jgi:hypothetical protein